MKHFGTGTITLSSGVGTLQVASASFHEPITAALPPVGLKEFLLARGWHVTSEPNKVKWQPDLNAPAYTWEQAMAIEFYKFITIGGYGGQSQT